MLTTTRESPCTATKTHTTKNKNKFFFKITFLYTNNEQVGFAIKYIIPFTLASQKFKYLGIKFNKQRTRSIWGKLQNTDEWNIKAKWRDISSSWIGKLNIVKISVIPKLTYRLNVTPIKIPAGYFVDINKLTLKWKGKRPRIANTIWKEKNKVRELILPYFKTYYKAVIIKLVWNCQRTDK